MKVLVQRVSSAAVSIEGKLHASIARGLLIFLGVTHTDTSESARYIANRCADLRVFEDAAGKMNLSVNDIGGDMLVISQFTLYGDTRKGNRPSFIDAAPPPIAEPLYEQFIGFLRHATAPDRVRSGVFRAMMDISLVNDGPVTLMIESKDAAES